MRLDTVTSEGREEGDMRHRQVDRKDRWEGVVGR